jgi:GrpB-like predicted nucleotidyltransferase (UPF0157 family)
MKSRTPKIPGFSASAALVAREGIRIALPPHPGPKEGGEVLPFVKIVDYDSRWPSIFKVEKQRIVMLTGDRIVGIEHFGSTSIPRICAKPVIDILAGLGDWRTADDVRNLLFGFDYRYIGGLQDWFILGRTGSPAFRLHLVPHGSFRWEGFLALRDYLRSDPKAAAEYCRRKRSLGITHHTDRLNYAQGKRDFLDNLQGLAVRNISATRLVSAEGSG